MKDTACIAIDLGATSGRVILAKMKHGRLETEIVGTAGDGERDVEYIHRPGNFESGGASGRPRDIAGDAGCHRKYQPVHVCRA